ncbi:MAG: regulatory protein RecX [Bacteroidota bacterium]
MKGKERPNFSKKEAKLKAANYCAYQERSQQQVRNKLYEMGLTSDEVDEVLTELIMEGFVNEERFAKAFAGGKFRIKKWGRIRITRELKTHNISAYCIENGLAEIDEEEYIDSLKEIAQKKKDSLTEHDLFVKREKVSRHLIYKGFEPDLVWTLVSELIQ